MPGPSYKLVYFNSRGGAEVSRLLFAVAGREYEDVRIPKEEWPNKKPDQPLKAVPVLEVDGKKYCQGSAIARYLAREFDLMGKTNMETFRIEELQEAFVELFQAFIKGFHEQDPTKKEEMRQTLVSETLPKFCTFFEMRLCENDDGNGFFVGKELTLGDILLYNSMQMIKLFLMKGGAPDPFEKFLKLQGHYSRIEAVPKIAEWVKKRPVTEM